MSELTSLFCLCNFLRCSVKKRFAKDSIFLLSSRGHTFVLLMLTLISGVKLSSRLGYQENAADFVCVLLQARAEKARQDARLLLVSLLLRSSSWCSIKWHIALSTCVLRRTSSRVSTLDYSAWKGKSFTKLIVHEEPSCDHHMSKTQTFLGLTQHFTLFCA